MKKLLTTTIVAVFLPLAVFSQCSNLKLSVDKKIQCAPGIVNYKLTGAPSGSSYLWDFGKGFVTNTDTVYEFYVNPQVVDVDVKVTFPDGTTCTVSEKAIAQILDKPEISYEISRRKLCDGPDTITLVNTTPKSMEISWVVDGTNYFKSTNTLVHEFKTPGEKSINMVVTDSFGCRDVKEFENVAIVHPDVTMDFKGDNIRGCVTKQVQFTPTIKANGEKIETAEWSLPGANTAYASGIKPPKVRYVVPGKYDVSLSVTTENGCTHTLKKPNYLHFGDSIKLKVQLNDTILCMKNSTQFSVVNPIKDGSYSWKFSGAPDTTMTGDTKVDIQYSNPGEYDVQLTLNYGGCFSSLKLPKKIQVKSLEAKFASSDNYHCYTPHISHITNRSSAYNNEPLTYQWSVRTPQGKKLASSTQKDLTFPSPDWGRYDVELIVKDPYGCKDTVLARQYIRVDSIQPTMTSKEKIGCVNQEITLNSITPASSYISPDSFYWIVYDLDGKTIHNQGKGRNITQTFSKPGYYNVTLQAGNLIGCKDTLVKKKYIHIIEPSKSFEATDSAVCSGEEISLVATTTPEFAPFIHSWKLTNSTTGQEVNLESDTAKSRKIKLTTPGEYNVQYSHQISDGCKDSLTKPNFIKVNGVKGVIKLDVYDGCLPFVVKPTFTIHDNFHFGDTSEKLTYRWTNTGEQASIDDKHSATPTFTFTKRGTYKIYVDVYNSTGCRYSVLSQFVYAGVKADFSIPNDSICALNTADIVNKSSLRPTKFEWNIISKGKYKLRTASNPVQFTPESDEFYTIQLIASKNNQCFDTMERKIRSILVKSDFEMADTHLFCAPAYAQFNTLSVNADTFMWDFGDGNTIKTTDPFIANIYRRNTGFNKGFDVSLTSKSYLGCEETITKRDAVKIFGPIPNFEIKNPVGCEPLRVEFINKSTSVAQFFLNFDDNTELDSSEFKYHDYRVLSAGMSQQFIPSLYVRDSLGCAATFESTDTVRVLKSPIAIPSDKEIEGCSPVQVALTDESLNITSRRWLLNKVEISADVSINPSVSSPGKHLLELIVSNSNSCSDTSSFPITVNENPKTTFTIQQLPCLNKVVDFTAIPAASAPIEEFIWSVENNANVDSTTTTDYSRTFDQTGNHNLQLKVIDSNGCYGTKDTIINIKSVDEVPDGEITYVTVNDQDEIEIHWNNIDANFIDYSQIIDNENGNIIYQDEANQFQMTTVTTSNLKKSHCFAMSHTNLCGETGLISNPHCPIILNVTPGKAFALNLNWSAYNGWDQVEMYDIYRSNAGSGFEKIAEVSGSTLNYVDSLLCDQDYTYRITGRNNGLASSSNKDTNHPNYEINQYPQDVKVATVDNNKIIKVTWDSTLYTHATGYVLTKMNGTGTQVIETLNINGTEFIDENVDVNGENYIYKVQTIDHCLVTGYTGYIGRPMLLTGYYANDISSLSWTAYEQWEEGVEHYEIQLFDGKAFQTIAQVPGTQTTYDDKVFHEELDGEYNYRILAVSYNAEVKSISNHIQLIGASLVWVPNAFSPNEDDHNPIFKPSAQFVYLFNDGTYREYEMKIFNRWGEELFMTNDIKEGWDGTYMGKDCESESYLYHIRISGLDRVVYDKKGLVRLMR